MTSAQLCSPQHLQRTAVRCTSHTQPSCAAEVITRARAGARNNLRRTAVRMVSQQRRSCAAVVTRNAQLCSSSHTECTAVRSSSLGTYGHSGCCTGHAGACASGNTLATRVWPLICCRVGRVLMNLKILSACPYPIIDLIFQRKWFVLFLSCGAVTCTGFGHMGTPLQANASKLALGLFKRLRLANFKIGFQTFLVAHPSKFQIPKTRPGSSS
jgi:hypothetical protein